MGWWTSITNNYVGDVPADMATDMFQEIAAYKQQKRLPKLKVGEFLAYVQKVINSNPTTFGKDKDFPVNQIAAKLSPPGDGPYIVVKPPSGIELDPGVQQIIENGLKSMWNIVDETFEDKAPTLVGLMENVDFVISDFEERFDLEGFAPGTKFSHVVFNRDL